MIWNAFNTTPGWILVGAIALCIGSFLSMLVYRLPLMLERRWRGEEACAQAPGDGTTHAGYLSLWWPPSRCDQCQQSLRWRHNIPLLSFIVLKGCCAYCRTPISRHHFYIEALTLVLWLWLFYMYGPSLQFVAAATGTSLLIALAFIDGHKGILPDELTLLMLWLGLLINSFGIFTSLSDAVYGAAAGYIVFLLIQQSFALLRGRPGLGQGDLKLLAALGAWLGWQSLPGVVLLASIVGVIVGYTLLRCRRQHLGQEIAFGPYLAMAGIIGLLFGELIKNPLSILYGY